MNVKQFNQFTNTCTVCLEDLHASVETSCHTNQICYKCWKNYIFQKVTHSSQKIIQEIECPVCQDKLLSKDQVLQSLRSIDRTQYQEILLGIYLRSTKDIDRCPSTECKFAYLPQTCFFKKQQTCPICYTSLNLTNTFSLKPIITFIYITFMTNNCPKCEIPIDRISGCYHMTCSCRHEFCWYCLKNYKKQANSMYKQHKQKDCFFLLLLKFSIIIMSIISLILVVSGIQGFEYYVDYVFAIVKNLLAAIVTDGLIIIELFVLSRLQYQTKMLKKYLLTFLTIDLIMILCLYYFGLLEYVSMIIFISLVVLGVGVLLVLGIGFSITTWFNYIK